MCRSYVRANPKLCNGACLGLLDYMKAIKSMESVPNLRVVNWIVYDGSAFSSYRDISIIVRDARFKIAFKITVNPNVKERKG